MKNKKIILGLGTITALGAMSVGFIACVKGQEVKKIVDEAGYSKLTKEQVEELLKNVSTLTEAQMKKLIANLSTLTKEEIQELLNNSLVAEHKEALEFSMEADKYLNKETNKSLNHFESKKKIKDVIDRINNQLNDKGWSVVENPTRDNITWFTSQDIKEVNGRVLGDGAQKIKFKLKKQSGNNVIETKQELEFNFFVGQKDLSTITDKNIHHSATTKEKIVAELNKKEEFKNIDLTKEDFEIVKDSKKDPNKTTTGEIKIKAKDDSKKIKGEVTLTLETVKQKLNETHLTGFVPKNNTTATDVKNHINNQTGFKEQGNNITESDFDFEKVDATEEDTGGIKITPKGNTEGKTFILIIPKLPISLSLDEIKNHNDIKTIKDLDDLNAVNSRLDNIRIKGVTKMIASPKGDSKTDVTVTITIDNTNYSLENKTFDIMGAIKKT